MGPSQDPRSVERNRTFFAGNESYEANVGRLDTYRHIRACIDEELAGVKRLLDVGNGGVFDYDTSLVEEIVAVDLFLDQVPASDFPPNVTPRKGDALALEEPPGSFDGVLFALVFHHLVGRDADGLVANVRTSLSEAHRTLEPGGKLIVVESCVPTWFFRIEKPLYGPLARVAGTRLMEHPATLQLPSSILAALIAERFELERTRRIETGRWMLQFGVKWPSALTPARPYLFVGRKS
jgi:SAM-dependent methyltransferase